MAVPVQGPVLDGDGDRRSVWATSGGLFEGRSAVERSALPVRLNEVYPDPDRDLNGDEIVDQMDEFIEVFNPTGLSIDLSGYRLSDNQGSYLIGSAVIGPGDILAFFRNVTGLMLSNDEVITLRYPNGTIVDTMDYTLSRKGWALQRSPDGSERIRTGRYPTPGGPNPVPSLLINEVMPDPEGPNAGRQWLELLNIGQIEDLRDMVLTNNEAFTFVLPSFELSMNERIVVALGEIGSTPPHPPEVRAIEARSIEALFSSGDDLELKDREGTSLDYIAWGASKHIGGPKGSSASPCWDGKFWDVSTGAMSVDGSPNPIVLTNRSLSRLVDGRDTNSTADIASHIGLLGSSPGWENSRDPTLTFPGTPVLLELEKGGIADLSVMVSSSLNMSGPIYVKLSLSNEKWVIMTPNMTIIGSDPDVPGEVPVSIRAPAELGMGNTCTLVLEAVWASMDFLRFRAFVDLVIPSVELYLTDIHCNFEGVAAELVPEGALLEVGGKLCSGGELPCSEAVLVLSLFNTTKGLSDPSAKMDTIVFRDLKVTSRRSFSLTFDTKGFMGATTVLVQIDPMGLIEEPNEEDNLVLWNIHVHPAPSFQGQGDLRITEVLWNTTFTGCYVTVCNTGDGPAEISDFVLAPEDLGPSFPEDCWLSPGEEVSILWGEEGLKRVAPGRRVFRMDGKGPASLRMEVPSALPDLSRSGRVALFTRWRVQVDSVLLNSRGEGQEGCKMMGDGPLETTFGSALKRAKGSEGRTLDTNTTLDWVVDPMLARLGALLISPGPGGSGEFIMIEGTEGSYDLSGACLICRGRASVVPHGTEAQANGDLLISDDPVSFLTVHGASPDLTTGGDATVDGTLVPGCMVPGYDILVLPNDGAELLLLDRGNRVLDRFVWGPSTSGPLQDLPYDTVVWRSDPIGSEDAQWKALCRGSEPALSLLGLEERSCSMAFFDASSDLKETFSGGQVVQFHSPSMEGGELYSLAMDLLEDGAEVEVRLGSQPWDRDASSRYSTADPVSVMAACQALCLAGARILSPADNVPSEPFAPFIVCGNRTVVCYGLEGSDGARYGPVLPTLSIGLEGTDLSLPDIGWMGQDVEMADITPLIASFPAVGSPPPVRNGPVHEGSIIQGSVRTDISLKNPLDILPADIGEVVWALGSGGPVDVMSYLDLARSGAIVRLMVSPRDIVPSVPCNGSGHGCRPERWSGHRLDTDELERALLFDCIEATSLALSEGLDLEVRVLPVESGFDMWSGLQMGRDMLQLELPSMGGRPRASLRFASGIGPLSIEVMADLWEGCNGLPVHMGWGSPDLSMVGPSPEVRIQEVYPDTYLVDDPDEYIALMNTGPSPADLSGWTLSDDEGQGMSSDGTIMLPAGSIIPPGELFLIARDRQRFQEQNGHYPNLSLGNCSRTAMVLTCRGDLRLSNKGDSVVLRDLTGAAVDSVLYGDIGPLTGGGGYHAGGRWVGDPAPLPGWGNVLHRSSGTYALIAPDTNGKEDWMGPRPRVPGQSRFGPFPSVDVEGITVGACPDSGSGVLRSLISNTTSRLDVNVYELTSPWITAAMAGAASRGIEVRVILEGGPVGGRTQTALERASELMEAGAEVRFMMTDVAMGLRDRYSYDHAKYMISDGRKVMVSSDNFKDSSFPPLLLESSASGTRGWVIIVESQSLSEQLSEVFEADWNGPDMVGASGLVSGITFSEGGLYQSPIGSGEGLYVFHGRHMAGDASAQLLISPDHISLDHNPLIEAIMSAEEEVLVEAMAMDLSFLPSGTNASRVRDHKGHILPGVAWPNPYVSALTEAASRGVDVKVLLDGSDFDGDSIPDNLPTASALSGIAAAMGLQGNFSVRLHPPERVDNGRRLGFIHNKGMIIDRSIVWTSSFNLGPASAHLNREIGVLLASEQAAGYFRSVFMFDWGGALLKGDPVRSIHYRPAGADRTRGVTVEIGLSSEDLPDRTFDMVLVASTYWDLTGPRPDTGVSFTVDPTTMTVATLTLAELDMSGRHELDVYVLSDDSWAHILRFEVLPFDRNISPGGTPWYKADIIPILGTVGLAMLFSGVMGIFSSKAGPSRRPLLKDHVEE